MKLYLAVTKDEYELPVYVEDSVSSLAKLVGMSRTNLGKHFNGKVGEARFIPYRFVKVEVKDWEDHN